MTRHLVYLSGPPGAGKSTLMAALTAGCTRVTHLKPFATDDLVDPATGEIVAVELGRRRETFSGTDALGMAVSPLACRWIADHPADLVLGEGDRLATRKFLGAAADAGYAVALVYAIAPPDVLDARCAARGSKQNQTWRKGRATKAANLADEAPPDWTVWGVDTTSGTPAELATELRDLIPVLKTLPEA